jgi:hypothetical protein
MTQPEFIAWLEGFLDGKLSAEDVAKVKARASCLSAPPPFSGPFIGTPFQPDTSSVPPNTIWPPAVTCGYGSVKTLADPTTWAWNGGRA